ncbi:MAG: hypothetical protein U0931_20200 [Vulcanimicrobiota bacterium]
MKLKSPVALTLLALVGCGSYNLDPQYASRTTELREFLVAPNFSSNSLTIRQVDLHTGIGKVSSALPSYGTHPLIVRSHPNLKVFYVVNRDSSVISQYSLDASGEASLLGTISCPANTQLLVLHPAGGRAYAAGNDALRTYSVSSSGILQVLGADTLLAAPAGWDADFSGRGEVLHIPEAGQIQSFPLIQGYPGPPVSSPLESQQDLALDVDVRPDGSSMEVVIQGHDSIRSYRLSGAGLPASAGVCRLAFRPALADFASNGQYYLGENGSPSVHAYDSSQANGLLTELSGGAAVLPGLGGAFFTALDPSEKFVFSTDGNSNNRLDLRLRSADGNLLPGKSDNKGLETPGMFDFLVFQLVTQSE